MVTTILTLGSIALVLMGARSNNGIGRLRHYYGGNSGYYGYSMSRRAVEARSEGRFPKTDFKKQYGVSAAAFDILVDLDVINDSEWHHTSMYGNKTTFYSWQDPEYENDYSEHKKQIDSLCKQYNSIKRPHLSSKANYSFLESHNMLDKDTAYYFEEDGYTPMGVFELKKEADAQKEAILDQIETFFG